MGAKEKGEIRKKGLVGITLFKVQSDGSKMFTKAALKAIFSLLGNQCQRTEQST